MPFPLRTLIAGLSLAALPMAPAASADGSFLQVDISRSATDAVATVTRSRLNFGASYNDYDGGAASGLSLTYGFDLEGVATLKAGPALGISRDDDDGLGDIEAGLKLGLDRYSPTSFGAVYLLGEVGTIDSAWFVLVQASLGTSGVSVELSRGGSDTYDEATLAVNARLGDGPLGLRAGWRFVAEEAFVGFTVNTF